MLLPSGHATNDDQPSIGNGLAHAASAAPAAVAVHWGDIGKYLDDVQVKLKDGWTVHSAKDGRLYYCNHISQNAGWLPPCENWNTVKEDLPYGWEKAIDSKGISYYINHVNKTTTYEAPICVKWDENPPEPRTVELQRSPTMGFGFVAGSERPVIVRFVTEGGPSVQKLQPGDQILAVNGEDVKEAPRDHVIQLVRSCESQVTLLVCQPASSHHVPGRKSTLLSAGKRAKLRSKPNRVRFAESVCVNGAPLFPPSAFSLGDICVPPMANVLKVFLENGQTKSFKYDASTTVKDVVTSLYDKLCLTVRDHFSLVLEHVKSLKRNKLTLLDPEESLARIAARPGAHKLRCLFRVTFVPVSAATLAQGDLNALDYLYMQCCNDVTQERFAPELQPDVALRLGALHMHQHALANNVSPAKLTVKVVEREFGLERFVPTSLMEGMKRKELRRLISHFLKLNSQMTGSSTKMLTQLQAKIHYLDIISSLPSYGAKCFSTNQREGVERVLLISPRFGLSQIAGVRNSVPQPISAIEDFTRVIVNREDDVSCTVGIFIRGDRAAKFTMDDRDACELSLVLAGYYKLLTGRELRVDREREQYDDDNAPSFLSQHTVLPASWSYLLPFHNRAHSMNFLVPPPYHSLQELNLTPTKGDPMSSHCDRNMNKTIPNNNHKVINTQQGVASAIVGGGNASLDLDIHSVMAMELLEGANDDNAVSYARSNGVFEAKNDEVLRRVVEMQKMVENSQRYLNEHGDLVQEHDANCANNTRPRVPWNGELDSDCDSLNSSKVSSNDDTPAPGALRHSDSLILLAEAISQDLNGISKGLDSIGNQQSNQPDSGIASQTECTPKSQRKVNGLSQLLSHLQALGNDCSQSESDSESVQSPGTSPTHRRPPQINGDHKQKNAFRTSFGLHSPDGSVLGTDPKDYNLKEYLKTLKEISKADSSSQDTDVAAKKLSEIYGFEVGADTFIETDPDLIDLRAIPPPQTPDELDALSILNAAPRGFGDNANKTDEDADLDQFLAKVIVAPPTQKITPAKELTPEEIMSFIIPPPPNLEEKRKSLELQSILKPSKSHAEASSEEGLYSNSKNVSFPNGNGTSANHVIEYATVERKGAFSCCSKSKKEDASPVKPQDPLENELRLPPRRCTHVESTSPPSRPPKSADIQIRYSPKRQVNFSPEKKVNLIPITTPPLLPPRVDDSPQKSTPPKKPPLPPLASRPILRSPHALPRHSPANGICTSPLKSSGAIGSPQMHRHLNSYKEIENAFKCSGSPTPFRANGHTRSNSDCPPVCLQNPHANGKPQLSLLCSPQVSRKFQSSPTPEKLISKNGYVIDGEALLAKTDIAMAGLLVKLDQVAAQCTAAQSAGGGANIDEAKFQRARDELTDQTLALVTASKLLVLSMSEHSLQALPEHLTSCLTSIRRITELTQDMTRHTSSPLQTRNIVLKVHDVTSSFRELAGVQIGPLGAGQLALQAECLANVLATLLRSLRVFSP